MIVRLLVTAFFRRKKKSHLRRLHLFAMAFLKTKIRKKAAKSSFSKNKYFRGERK
jgi:hypothetical protein